MPCYNRVVQEHAWDFYQEWTGPDFPRMLIIQIQHPTPYFDDSYAVNSANMGPYGDAITHELIPRIEERFRGIGEGWRENVDLRHILERDWAILGPKLEGKIHIYVVEMDNSYLNNAVNLMEDFLESTTDPYCVGLVDYDPRAGHCWNGDHERPNALSRLRYNQMYVPLILKRIEESAPPGADTKSWRY